LTEDQLIIDDEAERFESELLDEYYEDLKKNGGKTDNVKNNKDEKSSVIHFSKDALK